MQIHVKTKSINLTPGFKFDLERRLGRMYRKASESIRKIDVTLADINGPKGGTDKQCKLKLSLNGFPSILIVTKKDSVEKAFVEALKRANQTLFRKLKRQQNFNRQPLMLSVSAS